MRGDSSRDNREAMRVAGNLMRALKHDNSFHIETRVLRKPGERVLDLEGQINRAVPVVLDVCDLQTVGAIAFKKLKGIQMKSFFPDRERYPHDRVRH